MTHYSMPSLPVGEVSTRSWIWRAVGAIIKSTTNKAHDNRRVQRDPKERQIRIGQDVSTWAVQPAAWANFDDLGSVYCADIDTAYRVAQDQTRFGDQMIWKMTSGKPIKWVRVTVGEVVQTH